MEQNAQKEREKILEIKNLCMEFPAGKKKTVKAVSYTHLTLPTT